MLDAFNTRLTSIMLGGAAVIIFLLGFLVCADVFGRAFFNSPVKGTPELVSMSIVIICFLLAAYAVHSGGMISADVLVSAFGDRGKAAAQVLSAILGIAFFIFIIWGSYEPTLHAITTGEFEGEGALRVPVWPARTVVLVGAVLVVTSYVGLALKALHVLKTGKAEEGELPANAPHL